MSKADAIRALKYGMIGDPTLDEAMARWQQAAEWEQVARQRFIDDVKFANGDSENGYQWPNAIRASRSGEARPCLTMNIIRQHNLQISNEARKNKSTVKYVGTGNGATQESANIIRDIQRKIEYQSNAQSAYTNARKFAVDGGIGWWRLFTDYANDDSFDQEIFIGRINDPLSVYLDSGIQQPDGSDANWGFVFDTMPEEELYREYPDLDIVSDSDAPMRISIGNEAFVPKGHIMVVEYFRRVPRPDVLVSFVHQGERIAIRKSLLPPAAWEEIKASPLTKTRSVLRKEVEWKLIAGTKIVDSTIWPGKYIPLIRVIGEEIVIDGTLDRKGHTRSMKDSQRMYNYNASAQVEFVALQGKTPWVGPAKAIEEHETLWNTANLTNHSYLPYNHLDDEGQPIPPPTRTQPPTASPAYQAAMETAYQQMMMVSGQYQNTMGEQGNERTGAAIRGRQGQGETATFHFVDNYEMALVHTGKQLLDLIPKIYDTKRVWKILGEDGVEKTIMIDPAQAQASKQILDGKGQVVADVFNPQIGLYDVAASVGPAYGTKRQESNEMLTLLMTQNPQLTGIMGDLMLASMDFDKAQEAAQRLKRMVPKEALGEGPSPQEMALQQQLAAAQEALKDALEDAAMAKIKLTGKSQMRNIDAYEAETKRMAALKDDLPLDKEGLMALVQQLVADAMATGGLSSITGANANNIDIDDTSGGDLPTDLPPPGAASSPGTPSAGIAASLGQSGA